MPDSWQTAIWSTHTARRSYRSSCVIPPGKVNQRMSMCYKQQVSRTICSSTTLMPCILESYVIPGPPQSPCHPSSHSNPLLITSLPIAVDYNWIYKCTSDGYLVPLNTIGNCLKVRVYLHNSLVSLSLYIYILLLLLLLLLLLDIISILL